MTSALLYLLVQSTVNSVRARILRLKKAKYLASAIVGGLYFYFYFFRYILGAGSSSRSVTLGSVTPVPGMFESIGAVLLAMVVILAWIFPPERTALVFSEAEIAFLFPAPVSRRVLINFKLLKSQSRILFTVLFMTLFSRRFSAGGSWWIHLAGIWTVFSILNLHFMGASFTRTMLLDRGVSRWKFRGVVLGVLGACLATSAWWILGTIPAPAAANFHSLQEFNRYLDQLLASGPLPWLLFPFRAVIHPYFATDASDLLHAMALPVVIMAIHYFWVVRSDVAFEEASVEASQKMAERLAAFRAGRGGMALKPKKRKRDPFKMTATGPPSVALLWKNLIGANQGLRPRQFIVIAITTIAFAVTLSNTTSHTTIPVIAGVVAGFLLMMSVVAGYQLIRQDFRRDLPMADLLKTYPMRGWEVAFGELLAPAVILTGVQWLLIVIAACFLAHFANTGIPIGWRLAVSFALAVVLPALNVVTLVIPNGATLLFPGWFQPGKGGPQGIETMGQNLIFGVGQMLALVVALVPAAGAYAIAFFVGRLTCGTLPAIALAALPAALVLAGEAAVGIWFLGRVFDKFDLSAESASS